jgi:hypothetical protein
MERLIYVYVIAQSRSSKHRRAPNAAVQATTAQRQE